MNTAHRKGRRADRAWREGVYFEEARREDDERMGLDVVVQDNTNNKSINIQTSYLYLIS
jgi:hypothetical protein